jgi:hypothetical protein
MSASVLLSGASCPALFSSVPISSTFPSRFCLLSSCRFFRSNSFFLFSLLYAPACLTMVSPCSNDPAPGSDAGLLYIGVCLQPLPDRAENSLSFAPFISIFKVSWLAFTSDSLIPFPCRRASLSSPDPLPLPAAGPHSQSVSCPSGQHR